MSDKCPAVDQLFDWISTSESKRPEDLTEHIYGCSPCSRVVMAEVRIRRGSRHLQGLSGIAAVAILSLSLWQSDLVFSKSGTKEVASQEQSLSPTKYPPPVDQNGNLYWPDYPVTEDDPTPYPEEEEQFNRRSPRVVAWIKKKYGYRPDELFFEEGQKYQSLRIPERMQQVIAMSEVEFKTFANEQEGAIPGIKAQALERAENERAEFMLPLALLWYQQRRFNERTGLHASYHEDAARFIRLFSPEEVFRAIEDYPKDKLRKRVRDIYESNFLQ